ncbi:MAG TPA: hypothetical protein DD723_09555 [Candidatus Omnitrophica bacterium]|nr:MAG: hypothetical protein A2Z81_02945 [Omnitrophica WOR_2 bacterium GWA2_45_18]OGX19017.1 MAG: hypothetical protein A2Y04_00675 [Omnitrophica WOR_2 bacterium GWC2_45_7]HBR15763.1 hypothetical protein [Candidatus Omnitrophota bacterium]
MIKVLVVEDEPGVRNVLLDTFKTVGYETFGASSAKEAMELFIKERPDAIFLDVMLPDKSGLDVLKEMKNMNNENIVIVVSSVSDEKTVKKAKELGAAEFIGKPFFRESLRNTLAHNLKLLNKTSIKEKPKILIVDDEEDVCMTLNKYLKKRVDIDTVITFDGDQACDLISKNKFDIVIMDIKLPGKDGLTIIKETKNKTKDTIFLVLTGYLSAELLQEAKKLGVTEYFRKPMELEEIYKRMQAILIARNKFIPKE